MMEKANNLNNVMKQRKTTPKANYQAALAYYNQTVWNHVRDMPLSGAEYAVARLAWERLNTARESWVKSLNETKKAEAQEKEPDIKKRFPHLPQGGFSEMLAEMEKEPDIKKLFPHRLEREAELKPELLASLASHMGMTKPKTMLAAVEQAHRLLMTARAYLNELPQTGEDSEIMLDAYVNSWVSFDEISSSTDAAGCLPLLPTVQAKRNKGMLSPKALEQALKRYSKKAHNEVKTEINQAVKDKGISCHLLEKIRWQRFFAHYKS